jgi:hypothetical protein
MSSHTRRRCGPPLLLALALAWPVAAMAEPTGFFRATHLAGSAENIDTGAGDRLRTRESGFSASFGGTALAGGTLGVGLDYRYTRYALEGPDTRDWDLHWLRVPLVWQRTSSRSRLIAGLEPGVASSSNRFNEPGHYTREDLDVAARLLAVREGRSGLDWTAGLVFDRRFGRPRLYPTGGAILKPAAGWTLRLVAPDPEIVFEHGPGLRWFAALAPAGHRWHAIRESAGLDFEFETRAWRVALGCELGLRDGASIRLFAGRDFDRRYRFVDDAGMAVEADAGDAAFAGLSIVIPAFGDGRAP